jgi:hypothetical protein
VLKAEFKRATSSKFGEKCGLFLLKKNEKVFHIGIS